MFDLLIRNGRVIDGTGLPWFRADVGIAGDRIAAVGQLGNAQAKQTIDAAGKVVCPGFVDTHVHGDLALLVDPYHEPAVRQGVTTYVLGQDGVAFAPASPETMRYMRRYTAGFNGDFPTPGRDWRTVAEYLALFDRKCAVNVCTLIPNGNVRMEVMGLADRPPTADELTAMRRLVREGMEQGAVGLSSGLDYVPSLYADVNELTALCEEIAPFGGVYVTHMRGYPPAKFPAAIEEVLAIGREAGCGVHVSHCNVLAEQALPVIDAARAAGVDVTYDLYCYLYGSTIVGMITLPPAVYAGGIDAAIERLKRPEVRKDLEAAFARPRFPIETLRLASLPHPDGAVPGGRGEPPAVGRERHRQDAAVVAVEVELLRGVAERPGGGLVAPGEQVLAVGAEPDRRRELAGRRVLGQAAVGEGGPQLDAVAQGGDPAAARVDGDEPDWPAARRGAGGQPRQVPDREPLLAPGDQEPPVRGHLQVEDRAERARGLRGRLSRVPELDLPRGGVPLGRPPAVRGDGRGG